MTIFQLLRLVLLSLFVGGLVACGGGGGGSGGDTGTGSGSGGGTGGGGSGSGGNPAFSGYTLIGASYLDGASPYTEQARDVSFDSQGNLVIVGGTTSPDFPVTDGSDLGDSSQAPDSSGNASQKVTDAFVAKIDPNGAILWSTYLGGPNYDRAYAVEVAANDDVIVAGRAGDHFPTGHSVAGKTVVQPVFAGDSQPNGLYGRQDGFVTRYDSNGQRLWSTYVGGTGAGIIRDIDVDDRGDIYLAFRFMQSPPAATNIGRSSPKGAARDGYWAKLSADGTQLLFGTYIGGSTAENGQPSIRVGADGEVVFLSSSSDSDVCNTTPLNPRAGAEDMVVLKFLPKPANPDDYTESWCSYVGGSSGEVTETHSLALNHKGAIFVGAGTSSTDLPGAVNSASAISDAFITALSAGGQIVASRYFGAAGREYVEGITVAENDDIVFSGGTGSDPFPSINSQFTPGGNDDGFIGRVSSDLATVHYLSAVGGSSGDEMRSAAVYSPITVVVLGSSTALGKNLDAAMYGGSSQDLQQAWPIRLQAYLRKFRPGSQVINLSRDGNNSWQAMPTGSSLPYGEMVDGSNNIDAALQASPDLIIVSFPSWDDILAGRSPAEIVDNLETIVTTAENAGVATAVTTTQPLANISPTQVTELEALRDLTVQRLGGRVVDFWQPRADPATGLAQSAYTLGDDIHPNIAGHQRLLDALRLEDPIAVVDAARQLLGVLPGQAAFAGESRSGDFPLLNAVDTSLDPTGSPPRAAVYLRLENSDP